MKPCVSIAEWQTLITTGFKLQPLHADILQYNTGKVLRAPACKIAISVFGICMICLNPVLEKQEKAGEGEEKKKRKEKKFHYNLIKGQDKAALYFPSTGKSNDEIWHPETPCSSVFDSSQTGNPSVGNQSVCHIKHLRVCFAEWRWADYPYPFWLSWNVSPHPHPPILPLSCGLLNTTFIRYNDKFLWCKLLLHFLSDDVWTGSGGRGCCLQQTDSTHKV